MANHPEFLWAQNDESLFVTINIQDVKEHKIELKDNRLSFTGTGGVEKKDYALELDFAEDIDAEKSKYMVQPRKVFFEIKKKEAKKWWNFLLKDKKKMPNMKIDWNLWRDEDDSGDEKPSPFEGMGDMGGMGGMEGMGGMGGMGGMPGMGGGAGNPDIAQLMSQIGDMKGGAPGGMPDMGPGGVPAGLENYDLDNIGKVPDKVAAEDSDDEAIPGLEGEEGEEEKAPEPEPEEVKAE